MSRRLVASFVALGLVAGPALAATSSRPPTEKTKLVKHSKTQKLKETPTKPK